MAETNDTVVVGPAPVVNRGYTIGQLRALQEAISSGAQTVSYDGKTVTYRDLNAMLRVERIMMVAMGMIAPKSTTWVAAHDRGVPPMQGGMYGDVWAGY